jgi:ribulose-phosphate 3-epimerase
MIVIPSINAKDFFSVMAGLEKVKKLGASWAHLDTADGKFTEIKLWNNPQQLQASSAKRQVKLEVHLMVKNPDAVLGDWLAAGVKRIVAHIESAKNIEKMRNQCEKAGAELVLAVKPKTSISKLLKYQWLKQVLILTVSPGPAGQKFGRDQLKKIRSLRQKMPNVKIEVDGGINLETAKLSKKAGAQMLVSAAYIFNSSNPKRAYQALKNI